MMQAMSELYRFSDEAFEWLLGNITDNLDHYENPDADFVKLLRENGIDDYRKSVDVTVSGSPIMMMPPADKPVNRRHEADSQALDFYNSLTGMTPKLAVMPELLAYINHVYLHRYGIERWPISGKKTTASNVQKHWLTKSSQKRDIYEASISGRTWWIAHIARQSAEASNGAFDTRQALDMFSKHPEYYHHTMEFGVLRNPTVRAECIRALLNEGKGMNRYGYRMVARELNLEAGSRLLDVLTQGDARGLVSRAVDRQMCRPESVSDRRYLRGVKKFKVLSLGAGTQSTVMALMAESGWGGLEKPDVAIFADTKWEPPHVYKHLDWLEKQLSYKVIRVTAGDIRENVLKGVTPAGDKFLDMPVFLINKDGSRSVAARQCTNHYKIRPIHRELRNMLNLEPGKRAPKNMQVEMWMGISADEAHRMKPSRNEWITNRFPLIEMEISRAQLYEWFAERYPGQSLPRSACVGCPYHTDMEWKWIKENDPDSFNDAVFIDKAIRDVPHIRGTLHGEGYLHKDRKPLDTVDFSDTEDYEDFMASECEGLCGV